MRISLLIALGLVACSSDKGETDTADATINDDADADTDTDTDTDTDADADADTDCNVDIQDVSPRDNESGVYWRSDVTVWLDGDDSTASLSVTDEDGNALAGTVTNDDGTVTFTADAGLVPDQNHSMAFSWCGGDEATEFQTSELGLPLETDLTAQTFALDLGSATWIEPAGLGAIVGDALDMSLLVGVQSVGAEIDFIGALGADGTDDQDLCMPTIDFEPGDFSDSPYFQVGPEDLPVELMGITLTIHGMEVSGTFAADGGWLGGVELQGALDMAEVGPALGEVVGIPLSDPDMACDLLVGFGIECQPCPHKDEVHCLTLHLADIEANNTGTPVVEVAEAYCHEACEERDEHPECDEDESSTGL